MDLCDFYSPIHKFTTSPTWLNIHLSKQTQIPFTFSKEFQKEQKAESKPKPTQEQQIILQQEEQTLTKNKQLLFCMYSVPLDHAVYAVMSPNDSFRTRVKFTIGNVSVLLKSTTCPHSPRTVSLILMLSPHVETK